jgi:hypothetical protein
MQERQQEEVDSYNQPPVVSEEGRLHIPVCASTGCGPLYT